MLLQQQIEQDFLVAFKAKEEKMVSVLRLLKTALVNKKIERMVAKDDFLPDEETISVIKSEVKKRKDSVESYRAGGRADLAAKEEAEIDTLEKYLPEQLSAEVVAEAVRQTIGELAAGSADFGKVMGATMKKLGAAADGQLVSRLVKEALAKT
jgi:uncharacterized protein YqeY